VGASAALPQGDVHAAEAAPQGDVHAAEAAPQDQRDFDKYMWQSPIPPFDPTIELYSRIADLYVRAAFVAESVELKPNASSQAARRAIREALTSSDVASALDEAVEQLIQRT
jgi:hypothetical protein